jgi:hypothetical protein
MSAEQIAGTAMMGLGLASTGVMIQAASGLVKQQKWIKGVVQPHEKGRFHRQLGIPVKQRIPKTLVKKLVRTPIGNTVRNPTKTGKRRIKVTRLVKQRANFALNVGYRPRKRRR